MRRPAGPRIEPEIECWCGRRIMVVTWAVIREGVGVSCGHRQCKESTK